MVCTVHSQPHLQFGDKSQPISHFYRLHKLPAQGPRTANRAREREEKRREEKERESREETLTTFDLHLLYLESAPDGDAGADESILDAGNDESIARS